MSEITTKLSLTGMGSSANGFRDMKTANTGLSTITIGGTGVGGAGSLAVASTSDKAHPGAVDVDTHCGPNLQADKTWVYGRF